MERGVRLPAIAGRGAGDNPTGRFERLEIELDPSEWDPEEARPKTAFYRDASKSVIAYNNSPDIGYDAGINVYRGCEHGCAYCYARPTHEFLGLSAGVDFESKIMVKLDAPELLREALASAAWRPQVLGMSGVTDPYQPVERKLELTRKCLEVLLDFRNPVAIISKNHLITRDLDLLTALAEYRAVSVAISITTLDETLRRALEPRTSPPRRRLAAVRKLADSGVKVGVMTAPVIPGLNDHEIPSLVAAAADAGAAWVSYTIVHLPYGTQELFTAWLERHRGERAGKVLSRIREMRGGKLNDPRFGYRMKGEGVFAEQLRALHKSACRRAGLPKERYDLTTEHFRVPGRATQPGLFAEPG